MTPTELADVIEYCEDRWPGTRNYRAFEKVAYDFLPLSAKSVREAAQAHYQSGERTAPTLSPLRDDGARIGGRDGHQDPASTNCDIRRHHSKNRAITDIPSKGPDPLRESMCLDCGATIIRPANELQTVGEIAEAAKLGTREAPEDIIADRIAP